MFSKVSVSLAVLALCLAPLAGVQASGGGDIDDAIDDIVDDLDQPDIEEPEIDEPDVEVPDIDEPDIDEPDIEEPDIDEPDLDEPEVDEPEVDEPDVDEPDVDEPDVDEPDVDEPDVDEPDVDGPDVDGPDVDEPDVDEPDTDESDDDVDQIDEPEDELEDESGNDDLDEESGDDSDDLDDNSGHGGSDDESSDESADDDSDDDTPDDEDGSDDDSSDDDSSDGESSDDDSSDEEGVTAAPSAEAQAGEDWGSSIALSQDAEVDLDGNPVRRGEIMALDLSDEAGAALQRLGFVTLDVNRLDPLDAEVTVLRVPAEESAEAGLALARASDPQGIYDFGHYYAAPYEPSTGRTERGARAAPVRRVAGDLRIGLIDTAIRQSDLPRRVGVEARAFGRAAAGGTADHATAVASLLVANGAGELLLANVFDNDGRRDFTSAQTIGQALSWLIERHVEVINVSLAGPRNAVLDTLVRRAVARGTVIVAAAGNGGPTAPPAYPAALPDVVAVTAVDADQHVYRYANHGNYVRMASYGVRVPVELGDNATQLFTGTSFAAPLVSARLAACITGGSTRQVCVRRLEGSAQDLGAPGRDEVYGFGFVD